MHTQTYTHTHAHTHARAHAHTHTRAHTHTHIHSCSHASYTSRKCTQATILYQCKCNESYILLIFYILLDNFNHYAFSEVIIKGVYLYYVNTAILDF